MASMQSLCVSGRMLMQVCVGRELERRHNRVDAVRMLVGGGGAFPRMIRPRSGDGSDKIG